MCVLPTAVCCATLRRAWLSIPRLRVSVPLRCVWVGYCACAVHGGPSRGPCGALCYAMLTCVLCIIRDRIFTNEVMNRECDYIGLSLTLR